METQTINLVETETAEFVKARIEGHPAIPEYVVLTAKAAMPNSCKGSYSYFKVAVIRTDRIHMPQQIHPRHKAVKEIVFLRDRLFRGTTDQCAFALAKAEAEALAAELNGKAVINQA